MSTHNENSSTTGVLRLSGRFDFNYFKKFQEDCALLLNDKNVSVIDVNFSMVSYLDSSALGMLMLLHEKATTANKKVRIAQCSGMAKDILETANFQKQFEFV